MPYAKIPVQIKYMLDYTETSVNTTSYQKLPLLSFCSEKWKFYMRTTEQVTLSIQ